MMVLAGCSPPPPAAQTHASVAAQAASEALVPSCGGIYDLCGYARRDDRTEVIPRTFERVQPFSEGLAAVRIDGRFGYIDPTGKVIIKPQFDLAGKFNDGMAEVRVGDYTGVIGRDGKMLVRPRFARSIPLGGDVVVVRSGKYKGSSGAVFDELDLMNSAGAMRDPAGLYHVTRGAVTPEIYEISLLDTDRPGPVWARAIREDKDTKFGLMGLDGKWIVTPRYDHVQWLSEDRAVVYIKTGDKKDRKTLWGAVDAKGEVRVPLRYDHLSYWQDGYGMARLDGKQGFINANGQLLGGRWFDDITRSRADGAAQVQVDGKWFSIDANGKLGPAAVVAVPEAYRPPRDGAEVRSHCAEGVSYYSENGLFGLKAQDGAVVIPARFAAISCFRQGVAWVPDDKKQAWCAIGPDGKRREKPDCRRTYESVGTSHYAPEKLDDDPYRSSVLWMQAWLRNAVDPAHNPPPRVVGDGVRGHGTRPVSANRDG
jgi:hypothetical protein